MLLWYDGTVFIMMVEKHGLIEWNFHQECSVTGSGKSRTESWPMTFLEQIIIGEVILLYIMATATDLKSYVNDDFSLINVKPTTVFL